MIANVALFFHGVAIRFDSGALGVHNRWWMFSFYAFIAAEMLVIFALLWQKVLAAFDEVPVSYFYILNLIRANIIRHNRSEMHVLDAETIIVLGARETSVLAPESIFANLRFRCFFFSFFQAVSVLVTMAYVIALFYVYLQPGCPLAIRSVDKESRIFYGMTILEISGSQISIAFLTGSK